MRVRPRVAALAVIALLSSLAAFAPAGAAAHSQYDGSITRPDGAVITFTVFKPAAAADGDVPVIMHSHGWGGSRTTDMAAFQAELDRGYGVLSFDQRGFGDTGGHANVQDPEIEGKDVAALIDYLAGLDWVELDAPGDPVLFAMGLSYGGGYQMIGALTEVRDRGATRFNALAPEITWFNLANSLAPAKVARSAWIALLYAGGLQAHQDDVHVATAYGSATGQWPDGSVPVPGLPNLEERFRAHSPITFVEAGHQLDIPVLFGQGMSDNLFNFNQGLANFQQTLTPSARARSVLIGYNGGHALPNVLPPGYPVDAQIGGNVDPCTAPLGGFGALRLDFFDRVRAGQNPRQLVGGHPYHVATADGLCRDLSNLDANETVTPGPLGLTVTTTGAGAPQHLALKQGPFRLAGVTSVDATVTSVGADQRVFFGLSIGDTPATARVVHNNLMPLRELTPVVGEARTVELAGVAVDVPAGQNLYLTVTPVSDMYAAHGSARTPGAVVLQDLRVHLPVR